MSNQSTSRRSFIAAALSGTAALAGCNAQAENSNEKADSNSTNPSAAAEPQTTTENTFSQEEFEESLKALVYDLNEDLSQEGFNSNDQIVELLGEEGDNVQRQEGKYNLYIGLDSDSLLNGSGLVVGDQDFYTAANVGAMHEIFEDGKRQLDETNSIINKRLNKFSEENEFPEDYQIGISVEFEGERNSSTGFGFEYGEETVEEATEEFLEEVKAADQKDDGHRVRYKPVNYENLALLEDGESLTFHIDDGETSEEHTLEYRGGEAVFIDGEMYAPREGDGMLKTQVLGEGIRVNQFNPLYLQERGEIPEAVELKFEDASPNY